MTHLVVRRRLHLYLHLSRRPTTVPLGGRRDLFGLWWRDARSQLEGLRRSGGLSEDSGAQQQLDELEQGRQRLADDLQRLLHVSARALA